jgi:hypothetical protein
MKSMETCQNIRRPACKGGSGSNPRQATNVYADISVLQFEFHNTGGEAHMFNSASVSALSDGDKTLSIPSNRHSFLFTTAPAMLPLSRNRATWTLGMDETKIWC